MEGNNISQNVFNSINDIFSKIFNSIDENIYNILDDITFINSDIIENSKIKQIIGNNSSEGILLICNALILGTILYYSINYLISHLTLSKVQPVSQFIFRLIIFAIIMNTSIWVCMQIIDIISIITNAIRQIGEDLFKESICFSNFIEIINEKIYLEEDLNLFSFNGVIKSFVTFGFVSLIFSNALRYIMIQVFIIISPFSFITLINTKTECFFNEWITSFLALLIEQILISVILILAFSMEKSIDENIVKILYVGIIYGLTKSNIFMNQLIGGISTTVNIGINSMKTLK